MKLEKRKLSDLKPNAQNTRKHNPAQIDEMVKSVKQFGVIRPIIIDENNVILCGHGLFEALKVSGASDADCQVLAGLSDKQKKKLMLADNKIYELGTNDYANVEAILAELGAENDFEIPGYNSEILEEMYGIRSVENEVKSNPNLNVLPTAENSGSAGSGSEEEYHEEKPSPSARVQENREEAMKRNFIICPHCGGTIEV